MKSVEHLEHKSQRKKFRSTSPDSKVTGKNLAALDQGPIGAGFILH